ncbi:MAG: PAS domain S-box protein [Spirochaetota bacterium]
MKILVIEDNPDHQLIIRRKIEEYYRYTGVRIDSAFDAEEAKNGLEKYSYDTVILDYRLRESSGLSLLKWMKKKMIDPPVIMLTSMEDVEVAVKAVKLGVYEYICKTRENFNKLPMVIEKVLEEHRIKKKLEETEYKYHTLVEGMNEAVFLISREGKIIYISNSIKKLFGYSEQEFKEKFPDMLAGDERNIFWFNFRKVLQGEGVDPFVVAMRKKDHREVFAEINESRFVDGTTTRGVLGTIQDVTSRVVLEKEVASERKKVIDIFNSMVDWVYIVDGQYNIEFINRALARNIGDPYEKKCYQLLYQKNRPCGFCKWGNVRQGYTVRWELKREKGRTYDIISSPVKNPDGSISKMEILRDITRRKNAEEKYRKESEERLKANRELKKTIGQLNSMQEQLVQSEKMAALGKLVAGVAHEMNNPLFSAMGYTELVLTDSEMDESRKEKLNTVLDSIKRAKNIMEDLLHYVHREDIAKEEININQVVDQALMLRNYNLTVNNIHVSTRMGQGLPPVNGNYSRLQQVFLNIIINAEQAIQKNQDHGQLNIRSFLDEKGPSVVVEISNDGPPIPPEILGKIFDPFFTTREVGKGSGLGLSTAYGIIKDHGGDIRVKSDRIWTAFQVILPACTSASLPAVSSKKARGIGQTTGKAP